MRRRKRRDEGTRDSIAMDVKEQEEMVCRGPLSLYPKHDEW